jgi:hypothetical protein
MRKRAIGRGDCGSKKNRFHPRRISLRLITSLRAEYRRI